MSGIVLFLNKIVDLFNKRSKNIEKEQDLQLKKQDDYKKVIGIIVVIFTIIIIVNAIFPRLDLSSWHYDVFEKLLNYITGGVE